MTDWITYDLVPGDVIEYREGVWRNKKIVDHIDVTAQVESVGQVGDDWLELKVISSSGKHALESNKVVRRKIYNVVQHGLRRKRWSDETAREQVAKELSAEA